MVSVKDVLGHMGIAIAKNEKESEMAKDVSKVQGVGELDTLDLIGMLVQRAFDEGRKDLAHEMISALAIGLATYTGGFFSRKKGSRITLVAGTEKHQYITSATECQCKGLSAREHMQKNNLPVARFCSHMVVHWLATGNMSVAALRAYLGGVPSAAKKTALESHAKRLRNLAGWTVDVEGTKDKEPEPEKAKAAPEKAKAKKAPARVPTSFAIVFNAKRGKALKTKKGSFPKVQVLLDIESRDAYNRARALWGDAFSSVSTSRIDAATAARLEKAGRLASALPAA